uniref:Uncharacterized protein n=1 Tax=Salarias fasciatus TaxID=181472 RepID=A0A672IIM2_SALFA
TMKLLVLALTVALLFTAGEALTCHRCIPKAASERDCELSVETCPEGKNGCASVSFKKAPFGHFQKCMALNDCELLKTNAYIKADCCAEDMCNDSRNSPGEAEGRRHGGV